MEVSMMRRITVLIVVFGDPDIKVVQSVRAQQ
jgi:hypothetical protein